MSGDANHVWVQKFQEELFWSVKISGYMVVSNWSLSGSTSSLLMSERTKTKNIRKHELRHFAFLHVYIKYKQFTLNAKVPPPGIEPGSSAWQADILTTILQRNCIIAILGGYSNHYSTAQLYFCEFGVVWHPTWSRCRLNVNNLSLKQKLILLTRPLMTRMWIALSQIFQHADRLILINSFF